jgi:RNA polymerase sigma-70 factor (ECF subfamily)
LTAAESAPIGSRDPSLHAPETEARAATESDVDLVRRARSGDRPAFAVLYARHAASVHGVCLATGPIDEANDLVQEVFLSAWRALDQLEDPTRIGAWLVTIARNRSRDALRERGRTVSIDASASIETHASPAPHAASDDAQDSEARAVMTVIQSLPESYRETLVLRLVEGLTGPEIAERTGLTHGSVRVNLHRGMKLLRERLERTGESRANP